MSQRTQRVDELLRQEIGAILARDVQDPHIGFATITDVETAPDLRHARVWVSVIGADAERTETLAALERAMGYVRHELGRRLRLKRIPELHVRLDESAERGTRVLRLLSELDEGRVPEDLPEGETLPTPVARIGRPGDAEEPASREDEPASGPPSSSGPAPRGGPAAEGRRGQARKGAGPRTKGRGRSEGGRRPSGDARSR